MLKDLNKTHKAKLNYKTIPEKEWFISLTSRRKKETGEHVTVNNSFNVDLINLDEVQDVFRLH